MYMYSDGAGIESRRVAQWRAKNISEMPLVAFPTAETEVAENGDFRTLHIGNRPTT